MQIDEYFLIPQRVWYQEKVFTDFFVKLSEADEPLSYKRNFVPI